MKVKYSIKDLENLSGIKAHTIRIWEQRHNIIEPKRTDTNIRFYEDDDLRKLLNVSFLVHDGIKISKVATLNEAELHELVRERNKQYNNVLPEVNDLKMAMFAFDTQAFSKIFTSSVEKYGVSETFTRVLGDFINQLGLLWQTKTVTVAHEHFVSNLIKQKLYSAIDGLRVPPKADAKTFMMYLPHNELHEIGLLYLQFYLLSKGQKVIFFGQNTPLEFLFEVYEKMPFDYVVSVFTTHPHASEAEEYLHALKQELLKRNTILYACGGQVVEVMPNFENDNSIKLARSLSEIKGLLPV